MIIKQLSDLFKINFNNDRFELHLNDKLSDRYLLNSFKSKMMIDNKIEIFQLIENIDKELINPKNMQRLEKINSARVVYSLVSLNFLDELVKTKPVLAVINSLEKYSENEVPYRLIFVSRLSRKDFDREIIYRNNNNKELDLNAEEKLNVINNRSFNLDNVLAEPMKLLTEADQILKGEYKKESDNLNLSQENSKNLIKNDVNDIPDTHFKSRSGNSKNIKLKDNSHIIVLPDLDKPKWT